MNNCSALYEITLISAFECNFCQQVVKLINRLMWELDLPGISSQTPAFKICSWWGQVNLTALPWSPVIACNMWEVEHTISSEAVWLEGVWGQPTANSDGNSL